MATPIDRVVDLIRRSLNDGQITKTGIEEIRQASLHAIDHDLDPDIRAKLREALDTAAQPDMRSFQTDSGIFRAFNSPLTSAFCNAF